MQLRRYGWLVLIGLLVGCAALLLWFNSMTQSVSTHASVSEVVATAATAESTEAVRNTTAANDHNHLAAAASMDAAADPAAEQCIQEHRRALRRQLDVLAQRENARSQLAIALLAPSVMLPDGTDDYHLHAANAYSAARRFGPEDPLVAWLEALNCNRATCDREAAIGRLAKLEPDNAAVWLLALNVAHQRGDLAAAEDYLARAAQAGRYDLHFGEAGLLVEETLIQVPLPPSCRGEALERMSGLLQRRATDEDLTTIYAGAVTAAAALPPFQSLAALCRIDAGVLPAESHLPACVAVFSRMAGSDTLIAQSLALVHLVQYTADQPEGAQWRERLRNLRWLMEQGWKEPLPSSEFVRSSWVHGEVPTLQARLTASGNWPAPPGWLPKGARDRALITTGRPPPKR